MSDQLLWYKKSAYNWNEALPMGNGRLAGMFYGGEEIDRIQINEDTLWSGTPYNKDVKNLEAPLKEARTLLDEGKFIEAQTVVEKEMLGAWTQSYLPMGELQIQHYSTGDVNDYYRDLNLQEGVSSVAYTLRNQKYNREYFVSNPDDAFVIRYTSTVDRLNLLVRLASPYKKTTETTDSGSLIMTGVAPSHVEPEYAFINPGTVYGGGMDFESRLQVKTDGQVESKGDELYISNATEVTFYLTGATSFNGYDAHPATEGKNPHAICEKIIEKIMAKSYESIKENHIKDFTALMNKVTLELVQDASFNELPTDERISRFKDGKRDDNGLYELLFQFGRYLMVCASRPGTQSMHLQGIWNKDIRPVWSSNSTININSQMNYWQAETTNLSDCHQPLFDMIKELSETGSLTAKSYGCRGWASHHNIDIWRNTIATGEKNPKPCKIRHAFWPFGGVWLCQHLWEHYAFTLDQTFLEEFAYPILRGAALFCVDWVIKNEDGTYKTSPSTSPENLFFTPEGHEKSGISETSTMDIALIRNLFANIIKASEVLDIDESLRKECADIMAGLPAYQIGQHGQFMEWSKDYEEFEPGHRHQSHLVPLFPGNEITPDKTPALADACEKSIQRRLAHGGGYTGWSCAWIINLLARLRKNEQSYNSLNTLITQSIQGNMMDSHPPMQVDGNFGATSGITEMLLQSHEDFIRPLPSLPAAWTQGSVTGLRARGAITVGLTWSDNKVDSVTLVKDSDGEAKVYSDVALTITEGSGKILDCTDNVYTIQLSGMETVVLSK